jgi:hypothetical protein
VAENELIAKVGILELKNRKASFSKLFEAVNNLKR